ncbi:MAG: 4Fe-4S dicluster-binding protein [Desulfurococcaceae archaeon]
MIDLSVEIAGLRLKNPLMNAACPISRDAESMIELVESGVGGVVAKTISTKPAIVPRPSMAVVDRGLGRVQVLKTIKPGDIRAVSTDSGSYRFIYAVLNAELWSDIPAEHYLEREYPVAIKHCKERNVVFIASIGYTLEELSLLGPKVEKIGVDAIEFSTHYIGRDFKPIVEAAKALRESVEIPIFAKLSPFTPNIPELVKELEKVGVNGVVATNTIGPALHIDVDTGIPIVGGPFGYGWMSGPALKPLALAVVAEVAMNTKLPIIGVGGIQRGVDVVEYIMAGASAVQLCTAVLIEGPSVFKRILSELENWMRKNNYTCISDFRGKALKYIKPEPRRVWAKPPVIDLKKCIGCGLCQQVCNYKAVKLVEEKDRRHAVFDVAKCYGCGLCTSICPTRAIQFLEQ